MKKFILVMLIISIIFVNPAIFSLQTAFADVNGKTVQDYSEFYSLSDPDLLKYVEDSIYLDLIRNLDSEDFFVEKVEAVFISKEFLDEVAFNSQENIFFGYSLAELDERFQGKRYVFTLGDDGTTIVKEFEGYDDTYEKVIRNVAIGSGVILLCVTVTIVSGGLGAPAVSAIFAASAKTGAEFALYSGAFSGISSGIITGIETGDFSDALKSAALNGSESFKWGAISGALSGGISEFRSLQNLTSGGLTMDQAATIQKNSDLPAEVIQSFNREDYDAFVELKDAQLNGLSLSDAARIQHESQLPVDIIKDFRNLQEYEIYMQANLKPEMINNRYALIRSDINCCALIEGKTNLERMQKGKAALDPSGNPYQLHHIAQNNDSFLAVLTDGEHKLPGLHINEASRINRDEFAAIRSAFWIAYGIFMVNNGSCAACPIR